MILSDVPEVIVARAKAVKHAMEHHDAVDVLSSIRDSAHILSDTKVSHHPHHMNDDQTSSCTPVNHHHHRHHYDAVRTSSC